MRNFTMMYALAATAALAFLGHGGPSLMRPRDSVKVRVEFSAQGAGTVDSKGLYTAGAKSGSYRVIAVEARSGRADTAVVTVNAADRGAGAALRAPAVQEGGRPFGPFGLWNSPTSVAWGPAPFTASQNFTDPRGIVAQITTARVLHQRLLLAMTGGSHDRYLTAGGFDFRKWQARMQMFNTPEIREAVAQGVADGTVIGNSILDEPEHRSWGGTLTKSMLDEMASYAKTIFPTLPMGVNHGPTGYYQWRPQERYRVVDYVVNQYNWWVTEGDIVEWRDKVLAQAKLDDVAPAFSLNINDGGVQDKTGKWECNGTGGRGNREPNCEMSADQILAWGSALGSSGCVLLMWKFDPGLVAREDNLKAINSLAARMAAEPAETCRRR